MVAYKGHVLASDMTGGFYSLKYDDSPLPLCADRKRPAVGAQPQALGDQRATRILLRGTASDRGCTADAKTRERAGRAAQGERRRRAEVRHALPLREPARARWAPRAAARQPVFLTARGNEELAPGAARRVPAGHVCGERSRDGRRG